MPEGDVEDLLEAEIESEMDPALFNVEGDPFEGVGVSATLEVDPAIA